METTRKIIYVDSLPNKTWEFDELIALGISHGLSFGGCTSPSEIKGKYKVEEVVEILYNNLEFVEWQNPVEEIRGRKANPSEDFNTTTTRSWEAKVKFVGNGFYPFTYEGRTQLFNSGTIYTFGREHKHIVDKLNSLPFFEVTWEAGPEDTITKTLKSAESMAYNSDDGGDSAFLATLGLENKGW